MDLNKLFEQGTGFEWDEGNLKKNWVKHHVSAAECEQAFFNEPLQVFEDVMHSEHERRFNALGRTDAGRRLFVVFVTRKNWVRVLSARDMSRKERKEFRIYEKENPAF